VNGWKFRSGDGFVRKCVRGIEQLEGHTEAVVSLCKSSKRGRNVGYARDEVGLG